MSDSSSLPQPSREHISSPSSSVHSFDYLTTPPEPPSLVLPSAAHIAQVNFTSCSLQQYSEVVQVIDDRFELIDGILRYQQMPDASHTLIQRVIASRLELLNDSRNPDNWISATIDALIAYKPNSCASLPSRNSPGSSNSADEEKESCVEADITVGPHISPERLANLSPGSRVIHYPETKPPPFLVIEITSNNRINDITFKTQLYAQIGIPEYVIIDRQQQCVTVHKLNPSTHDTGGRSPRTSQRIINANNGSEGCYRQKRLYHGDEVVEAVYISQLCLTANELLKPTKSSTEVALSPIRKERNRTRLAESKIKSAESKVNSAENRARSAESKVNSAENRARSAESKMNSAENRARSAETRARSAESEVNSAENRARSAESKLDSLERRLKKLEERISSNTGSEIAQSRPPNETPRNSNEQMAKDGGSDSTSSSSPTNSPKKKRAKRNSKSMARRPSRSASK